MKMKSSTDEDNIGKDERENGNTAHENPFPALCLGKERGRSGDFELGHQSFPLATGPTRKSSARGTRREFRILQSPSLFVVFVQAILGQKRPRSNSTLEAVTGIPSYSSPFCCFEELTLPPPHANRGLVPGGPARGGVVSVLMIVVPCAFLVRGLISLPDRGERVRGICGGITRW